ncbi:MAG: tryptophan-rich sensory protein [Paracoccaceae bacterium]|nr:tryptophan-rich sensory protein [Paracoccaceae bacterium]
MNRTRRQEIAGFAGFLLLCLAVSALGGLATSSSVGTWYPTLAKPSFNPPDWVFAPVWTTLYIVMAIAGWRVWRTPNAQLRTHALSVFYVQLALNLLWSILFFGLQAIGLALAEIIVLLVAIIITMVLSWRVDRLAGMLFLPYTLWVAFASLLNAAIFALN